MYALWSVRLAGHLAERIIGEPEEGRYVELRQRWAANLNAKFFGFFQLQALLNVILAVPLLIACLNPEPSLHVLEAAGVAIWLVGLIGESIADGQLAAFKQDASNHGRVCDVGLWRYSRHPNYFFEWTIWIGYAVFALASPWGWLALAMPALMLHFLINVTGVKATEEQALRSRASGTVNISSARQHVCSASKEKPEVMTATLVTPRPADPAVSLPFRLLARNLLPDSVVRFGIRRLLAERLREETRPVKRRSSVN